ncbi:MAG TPA: family 43 glycosylhydrolase [Steroidobacteraceae bacterium]|nr:family 43 glycosylhydrolase [Steroidobacteraceae bacterium]
MKPTSRLFIASLVVGLAYTNAALATNPLVTDQFTADPTARVFEGRIYVYPSHDIKEPPGYTGRPKWFVMEDYHVFSSDNLTDWKDHGVIVTRSDVPWADQTAYAMWAPDCVFKDGKYYFYFPAVAKKEIGGGFRIGVAVADKPYGPFKVLPTPIEGVQGIDPGVLQASDGNAYLYWSGRDKLWAAKLKPNMTEIEGEPQTFDNLPKKGLQEGPFTFERNGTYYLTYPHVANKIERLEYATSSSPLGPYEWKGVILDESESGCWTVHHSLIDWKGQWYLFYHDRDLSPGFDKNRSIRADKLFFNADGTIQKVMPTLRGVGLVGAKSDIQIDRYSAKSPEGVSISFLDDANPFAGWKTTFNGPGSWVRFNEVDFGRGRQKSIEARVKATGKSSIEVRLDKPDGPVLALVVVDPNGDWTVAKGSANRIPKGVHDLFVSGAGAEPVEVDWISFR